MKVSEFKLKEFIKKVFVQCELSEDDAEVSSDVLTFAEKRGIKSHGARALRRYVDGIKTNKINPHGKIEILSDGLSFALLEANGRMGMPTAKFANELAISKAKETGIALVSVKNSNHFGVGSYYTLESCKKGMIGMVFTNTSRLGVPTFGLNPMFGTNPIAFSAPSTGDENFTLDISTTIVSRGFVDKASKEHRSLPEGIAINDKGEIETDPNIVIECLKNGKGGLLPLGGINGGGHKGYGLAVMVDILTGVLTGFLFGKHLVDSAYSSTRMSHSFLAIDISKFIDLDSFKENMKTMTTELTNSDAMPGMKVTYPGEGSLKREKLASLEGIEMADESYSSLEAVSKLVGINLDF